MHKIINYLKSFWKVEIKLPYFITITSFIGICIFIEYYFNATSNLIGPTKRSIDHFYATSILYAIPLVFSILMYALFYKRHNILTNYKLWIVIFYIIAAYAFRAYFYQHKEWVTNWNGGVFDKYLLKCANQAMQAILVFLSIFLFWKFSGHVKQTPIYGLNTKNFDAKPYFMMLLIMVPLVAIASTQSDFLSKYPRYQGLFSNSSSEAGILKIGIFEILYGIDFMTIELFFRGFVIYALAKYLGKGAILPMAAMYVFIHFGKPAGETISSFFGGIILGVIAFETRSIYGGFIVHCGIAYLMEIGGTIGRAIFK